MELFKTVRLVEYEVIDGVVNLPDGAQVVRVITEDTIGLGGGQRISAVLVAITESRYDRESGRVVSGMDPPTPGWSGSDG